MYPIDSNNKDNVGDALSLLIQDLGVVQKMHSDNAPEMVGRNTPLPPLSRYATMKNYGENLVRQVKGLTIFLMHRQNVLLRLWSYAMEYASDLHSLMVPGMYRNRGRTGYELVFGITLDMSEYVEFDFYNFCWYWDTPNH